MLCSEPLQRKPQRGGAAEGRPPLWWRPEAATFVLALNKAHVLALNTAHVLRLNKADVLALNKAHVLRLNNKICPVFRANTAYYILYWPGQIKFLYLSPCNELHLSISLTLPNRSHQ